MKESGGTLVINGDLFDFYFEYKDVIPKSYVPFYHEILKLREAGVKVHFILGNHDYWVRDFITETLFDHTYSSDISFEVNSKKVFCNPRRWLFILGYGLPIAERVYPFPVIYVDLSLATSKNGVCFRQVDFKKGRTLSHSDEYNKKITDEMAIHAQKGLQKDLTIYYGSLPPGKGITSKWW